MPDEKTELAPSVSGATTAAQKSEPREGTPHDKDIGDWKYSPWSGLARWVHPATRRESFDEKFVKREAKKK